MARKKKPEEHDNHERWLVSYADFITLLFAFFVVMYAISSVNAGKYRVLSDSLVSAFKNTPTSQEPVKIGTQPSDITQSTQPIRQPIPLRRVDLMQERRVREQTENMKGMAKDILRVMAPLAKEGKVKVTQSSRGVTIEINASVLFRPGLAVLEGESVNVLSAVAQVVSSVPNAIQVEGYTDDTPINSAAFPSNWELSTARASSVVRLFAQNGVAPSRLVAVGYAENRPIQPNANPESRARNRRVTVQISSNLQESGKEISIGGLTPEQGR